MKKILATAITGLMTVSAAYADQYQFQVNADYLTADQSDIETDLWALSGTYYFGLVDDGKGPLAEAAFLNKSTSMSLRYIDSSTEIPGYMDMDIDVDSDDISISGRYVNADSGLIVDGEYSAGELSSGNIDVDVDYFSVGVGVYADDQTTFVFSYHRTEFDIDNGDYDGFDVDFKRLFSFESGGALNLEVGLGYVDYEDSSPSTSHLSIGGDYYFCNQFSVGTAVTFSDGSGDDVYGVDAQYFISNNFSVSLAFAVAEYEYADENEDIVTVGVLGRF